MTNGIPVKIGNEITRDDLAGIIVNDTGLAFWEAYRGAFEPGDPIGYGETPEAAIIDLLANEGQ